MNRASPVVLLLLLSAWAVANEPLAVDGPLEAAQAVAADVATLTPETAQWMRYVWVPSGSDDHKAVVSLAVNSVVSRSSRLCLPDQVGPTLLRWDLRKLGPAFGDSDVGLLALVGRWDGLAQRDPYFHLAGPRRVPCAPYKASDGKTYNYKIITASAPAPYLGELGVTLTFATGDLFLCRGDWLVRELWTNVDGGAYYTMIGVRDREPLADVLTRWGVDPQQLKQLRAVQRLGMSWSGITGKPRRIEVVYGATVTPDRGTGATFITYDLNNASVKAVNDPIRNLLRMVYNGGELIAESPNGLQRYLLFDGNDRLVLVAPDAIASDDNVPSPNSKLLQCGISCLRCHGSGERAGYISARNQVRALANSDDGLDILGDVHSPNSYHATIQQLVSLYDGDIEGVLRRSRDTYSDAVFRCTGGRSVQQATTATAELYADYEYEVVDAAKAVYELTGRSLPPEKAVVALRQLLSVGGLVLTDDNHQPFIPQDPILGLLKGGEIVVRRQWEQVYVDAVIRMYATIAEKEPTQ